MAAVGPFYANEQDSTVISGGLNLGDGYGLVNSINVDKIMLKTLVAGDGITLSADLDSITIEASGGGFDPAGSYVLTGSWAFEGDFSVVSDDLIEITGLAALELTGDLAVSLTSLSSTLTISSFNQLLLVSTNGGPSDGVWINAAGGPFNIQNLPSAGTASVTPALMPSNANIKLLAYNTMTYEVFYYNGV